MKSIYGFLPEKIKIIMKKGHSKIPAPFIHGSYFIKYSKWLKRTQWFSKEEMEHFQKQRFLEIVKHAYTNVPYYRKTFQHSGISLKDIQSIDDIQLVPILTKDDIRKHFTDLIAKNFKKYSPTLHHTSGSTGEPVQYYIDKKLSSVMSAIVWRHWKWCGIDYGDKIAVFRGTLINDFGNPSACHFKMDDSGKQLHFSTFHMDEEVMETYIKKLNNFKPKLIRGYPASLEILANYIVETGKSVVKPIAVHTSSEMLLPSQRSIIEQAFDAPLFDWYSHGESTVAAGECECHSGLHLNTEFGYTEFLPESGVDQDISVYKLISTSLWNYSMPFLRYDTEDLVEMDGRECKCRRGLPLIKSVIGRKADIIIGQNGTKISPSSMVHFWKYRVVNNLKNISYSQIYQKTAEKIIVCLMGEKNSSNEKIIQNELKMLLGKMDISFEYLHEIPSGQKWRFTVSKVG